MAWISINVDLDDILSDLSGREKQKLVDKLYNEGYLQEKLEAQLKADDDSTVSINEQMFRTELYLIRDNYLNLDKEEIQLISNIAKRF
jgi:hypothetical protein